MLLQTLVAETLVLAKTHGYVEKIEHELEEELQRENTEPPNRILAKWRRKLEQILKNKYTLLLVALFCVTECALILGELILDLHKVKDVLEAQETASLEFVKGLSERYPHYIPSLPVEISFIYKYILNSSIEWSDNFFLVSPSHMAPHGGHAITNHNETRHKRSSDYTQTAYVATYELMPKNGSTHKNMTSWHHRTSHEHSLEEEIAHAFHMASITILSILVFETILKALCAGTDFFQRKLETFDLCIVLISFVVDLVCMQIMPRYKIQDFVFILAFLLPWRVIRVVNSLVVAVQDHEHFRLKLIYGRKKKIVNSLRESEIKLQLFRAQCNALKRLCFNEGIDESKIDQILMVEECVVNKAGKSKCKIKIDNSSVILLNDKGDFPRLSPRPSLLNLVEKVGRRKSMQPQCLSSVERETFLLNAKDSPKKGILKSRARSNSESGPGTLSSPDDGPVSSCGFMEGTGALSTPIIVNRKSSLSSPMMANHVRNILNSLEDKVNQMNGSCSRLGGGRGSIDEGSIPEEEEVVKTAKRWERRVRSIDETTKHELKGASHASKKRRASLQPQKCVDEDDADIAGVKTLAVPSPSFYLGSMGIVGSSSAESNLSVIGAAGGISRPHTFIPTTIQIDPPSTHSNYSLGSSTSINDPTHPSDHHASDGTTAGSANGRADSSTSANTYTVPVTLQASTSSSVICHTPTVTSQTSPPEALTSKIIKVFRQENPTHQTHAVNLKLKNLRTPSDIENQNNLTQSESSDVCESQSNDADTRNTSIEEIEDDFDNSDLILPISNTDEAVLPQAIARHQQNTAQSTGEMNGKGDNKPSGSKRLPSLRSNRPSIGSLSSKDGSSATGSSIDPSDMDFKSDSVSNLLM